MERQARSTGHTVSKDSVTVKQYYTEQEFEIPSVVFDVTTEREEPVGVRFVVTDIEAERVGFHPRFRSDAWGITDDRLVFEATVGPDETVTTLYALDTDDEQVFERAMESLRVERVAAHRQSGPSLTLDFGGTVADESAAEPVPADDSTTDDEPADASSEATAVDESATVGESGSPGNNGGTTRTDNSVPAVDDDPLTAESSEPREPGTPGGETAAGTATSDGGALLGSREEQDERGRQGSDPEVTGAQSQRADIGVTEAGATDAKPSSPAAAASSGDSEPAADDTDTGGGEQLGERSADALVEELLGRLDRGSLPPAARERLAERVTGTGEQSGANGARLADLQRRLSDIEAFSDPVEQLLDEHGPPAAALDALDERLTALEGLDERVSELETRLEAVDEHENRIERLEERVVTLDDELDTTTTQLETDVADVETRLEGLRAELERLGGSVETAREEASDAGAQTGELEERLAELEAQLDEFERQLDGVAGDWESVEADIEALQEWRSSLASTFEAVGK